MDTTYRKNLKAVLTASKNYTDNSIEKLKWELGTYDLSVTTDSTAAYTKTIPTNTIKGRLNYIGGASKVSENLIVLQDVAETTVGTLTYSISNGVLTLNGTGNGSNMTNILNVVNSQIATMDTSNYTLKWFTNLTSFGSLGGFVGFNNYYENYFKLADGETANTNGSKFGTKIQINSSSTFNNVKLMPMLVKGTTAPTEFKQGFEGIRSAKTTSVKFEGANLIGLQDVAQTTTNGITYSVKDGVITLNGTTSVNYWAINLSIPTIYAGTYYGTTFATSNPPNSAVYLGTTQSIYGNITTTTSYTNIRIYIHNINTVVNNWVIKPMLVRGSTAPTEFKPYIAPITKAIPQEVLNDVRYGLGFSDTQFNKLDLITKHLTGEWNIVDLGSLDWNYNPSYGTTAQGAFYCPTDIGAKQVANDKTFNGNCAKYEATSRDYVWYNQTDKKICLTGGILITVVDKDYTDAQAFKQAMSGVYLLYQTATQFDVDFSQYIDDDFKNIDTTNMATATFENEFGYDVPSEIDYLIEEVKA